MFRDADSRIPFDKGASSPWSAATAMDDQEDGVQAGRNLPAGWWLLPVMMAGCAIWLMLGLAVWAVLP